ncbi:hypothetical protein [Cupriavidus nantongensis]
MKTERANSIRNLVADDGYAATFQTMGQYRTALLRAIDTAPAPSASPAASFQERVQPWMMECFGAEIAADQQERNHRFLEEALELVQACGATASEAHQLVDYVYSRPVGEKHQEVGGVMVTLAALCLAHGLDMHVAGETELARIWTKVEQIRTKQAAKPKHSPLPEHVPPATSADDRLHALLADIRAAAGDCGERMQAELPAYIGELRRDAARYRWLRRGQTFSVVDCIGNDLRAEELDTAIDAALRYRKRDA